MGVRSFQGNKKPNSFVPFQLDVRCPQSQTGTRSFQPHERSRHVHELFGALFARQAYDHVSTVKPQLVSRRTSGTPPSWQSLISERLCLVGRTMGLRSISTDCCLTRYEVRERFTTARTTTCPRYPDVRIRSQTLCDLWMSIESCAITSQIGVLWIRWGRLRK